LIKDIFVALFFCFIISQTLIYFFAHYEDNKKKRKKERAAKVTFQFINLASFIEVKTDTVILKRLFRLSRFK